MATSSLKEYLKRYETKNEEEEQKKKRRKKKKTKPESSGVLVVDEDPVWQKPVKVEDDDGHDSPDETPVVDEDIEVKRMKRLEQIRLRREYNPIAEDGSGWVSLSPKRANTVDPNSDISPPSRQRTRNDTPSPDPGLRHSNSEIDLSPPRKPRSPGLKSDLSPPRSRAQDETTLREVSDLSPPRRRAARTDLPVPRVKASKDETDLSPPRKRRARNDRPSPEPLVSKVHGTDLSPPRKRRVRNDTPSPEPTLNRADGTDLSPPRKRRVRNDSPSPEPLINRADADLSPPRKRRARNDTPSPKRRVKPLKEGTVSDMSPPRQRSRRQHTQPPEPDIPPPSQSSRQTSGLVHDSDLSPPRKSRRESTGPPLKQQPKTGLISGSEIREEVSKTKKDDWLRFKEMDPSVSGRGAEPVYRDKTKGERVSKEDYLKSKRKGEDKPKEKELEWGKGLAQKREAEARLQELELEKNKPFARTRDDPELDDMLKDRLRWGDPMAHLVKKKQPEAVLRDLGDAEKMKESGFIIPQDIPPHSWIVRRLDAAPNRYGIRPGRHWDGVDRSNGFEKKMFTKSNEKQATEREAYLWSVSDM
ncbi:Bud siteselection protein 13 [Hibiscus trionum]|nr:Bud siteselection protein 13 [Hibiscus trionum]